MTVSKAIKAEANECANSADDMRGSSFAAPACSKAACDLVEALEAHPHLGMTESEEIWNAYSKFIRALGGKPMRQWWKVKRKKPQNERRIS